MSRKTISFVICVLFPMALAQASDDHQQASEFRVLQKVSTASEVQAVVMVKEGGHLLGQPFQVELRANCGKLNISENDWPVVDSFSVCDLSPESLKINNDRTAVAMKAKMADVESYDNQIARGVASPDLRCQKKTVIKKFSLNKICEK